VIDFFARSLERLSKQAESTAAVFALVTPAPLVSAARLVATYRGDLPLVSWSAAPSDDGSSLAIVGFGETVRIEGHGSARARHVSAEAKAMFAALRQERAIEVESAPGPFLVGGLSFRPHVEQEPWAAFADASFTLPRWTYVRRGARAWWWLCVRTDQMERDRLSILGEFDVLQAVLHRADRPRSASRLSTSVTRVDVADRDAYCALVADAIACIRTHATDKIVAVTSSHVTFGEPIDAGAVLERLDDAYPDTNRFFIQRGERVFVGASPERLVARRGQRVESDGLAGTARRGSDDATIVRELLTSAKDRREHAFVVESIASVLGPRCSALDVPDEPRVRTLRNVHHLWSPIRGVLHNETHVLELVDALHPTPAVAGTPRDRATAWIAEHEPTSRGWYTGTVGYFDAAGDGEFAVAIRAGLVGKHEAFLYAGAGIVEASDPPAEYAETRAKEAPMLSALGIAP
jgi:salicylate biosynthesis isochorismate synthase